MTSLLEIKEKIVGFYKNFEYPVQIIGKFILAMLAFSYINNALLCVTGPEKIRKRIRLVSVRCK